jgi:hypothetical protein
MSELEAKNLEERELEIEEISCGLEQTLNEFVRLQKSSTGTSQKNLIKTTPPND